MQQHTGRVTGRYGLTKTVSAGLEYAFQYTFVGSEHYSTTHRFSPTLSATLAPESLTALYAAYESKRFFDTPVFKGLTVKNGTNTAFGVSHTLMPGKKAGLALDYTYDSDSADAAYWSYTGNKGTVNALAEWGAYKFKGVREHSVHQVTRLAMKRPLIILTLAVLVLLAVYACSGMIRTANTSLVTITIGRDARSASLHAEGATPWARFKYFLAETKLMPEAYAYIPSVVQVLVVNVSAADMTIPIVGIASISTNQTTATLRIEAPNGTARLFTVEGIRGVDSQTYYRGTATTDLSGVDVDLSISMGFVGTGIYVDPSLDPAVADQPSCGTLTSPCATITSVLDRYRYCDCRRRSPGQREHYLLQCCSRCWRERSPGNTGL